MELAALRAGTEGPELGLVLRAAHGVTAAEPPRWHRPAVPAGAVPGEGAIWAGRGKKRV